MVPSSTDAEDEDDDFPDQASWDFAGTPDRCALLLNYHPLVIDRPTLTTDDSSLPECLQAIAAADAVALLGVQIASYLPFCFFNRLSPILEAAPPRERPAAA